MTGWYVRCKKTFCPKSVSSYTWYNTSYSYSTLQFSFSCQWHFWKNHSIYFCLVSCFCFFFFFCNGPLWITFTSFSLKPNQSPAPMIMMKTFGWVHFVMSFFFFFKSSDSGRKHKFSSLESFLLRNRLTEVDCLTQSYAGLISKGRFRTQLVLFQLQDCYSISHNY